MKYQEVAKRLKELGCIEARKGKGSHTLWENPATGGSTVVPVWGNKDLPPGTVRAILRQLGISREDFGSIK